MPLDLVVAKASELCSDRAPCRRPDNFWLSKRPRSRSPLTRTLVDNRKLSSVFPCWNTEYARHLLYSRPWLHMRGFFQKSQLASRKILLQSYPRELLSIFITSRRLLREHLRYTQRLQEPVLIEHIVKAIFSQLLSKYQARRLHQRPSKCLYLRLRS